MTHEYVIVLTTLPPDADAAAFGRALVEERLAACVNVLPLMESIYRWEGTIEQETERQVVMKTSREQVVALWERVRELHPYDVPEFLVLPIVDGNNAYLRWIAEATSAEVENDDGRVTAAASACLRSSMRSAGSSMPTEMRTRLSVSPIAARRSFGTEACVIAAGWLISVSTPPRLSASAINRTRLHTRVGGLHRADVERDHAAEAPHLPLRELVLRMARQPRDRAPASPWDGSAEIRASA